MDPQKLIFLNKKVVRSERLISLLFSLALCVFLLLVERGVIVTEHFSYPVFYLGLFMFLGLGVTQFAWNPYTKSKVLAYNILFAISGGMLSVFIVGYNQPIVFLAWVMLIITTAVYFNKIVPTIIYGIFATSSVLWTLLNISDLTIGNSLAILFSTAFIGFITTYVIDIWDLFSKNVKQLDSSIENEKIVRERLSSLINSMADGVLAVDENCKILEYNGALLNILDLNLTLRGENITKIGSFVDANNQKVDIAKIVQGTRTQQINRDLRIVYSDKTHANLYISIASVHLGFGHEYTKGFVLVMRDITREKSLEEERDEFISVISHELRTPIAIAEGEVSNAEFLAEKIKADEKIVDALKHAHDQVLFLGEMVNDLATLSRAERGKLDVVIEDINLQELIDVLIDDYQPQAKQKGLKFEASIGQDIKTFSSSPLYLKEILQNFITNSIKYTEKGSVTLLVSKTENGAKFQVTDTGIGISKSDQQRVFDKFFRSEDYRTRANSGTGLGLYVTTKLSRLIHADIEVESELNKGSKFIIKVPNLK